jgi:hypothetical protein
MVEDFGNGALAGSSYIGDSGHMADAWGGRVVVDTGAGGWVGAGAGIGGLKKDEGDGPGS